MTVAVIAFTGRGAALGRRLADGLGATLHVPQRFAGQVNAAPYPSLEGWTADCWGRCGGLIFVGAAGIAVRAIAPHIQDKLTDPAVVSVDEAGRFAVPLLSGHVGGGNALARQVATLTGGQAAISTATDVNDLFAVDVWATEGNMALTDRTLAKEVSAALLEGKTVGFRSDFGHPCPAGLSAGAAELGVWVTCHRAGAPYPRVLRLVPKCLTLGIGCRRGTGEDAIAAAVAAAMGDYDFAAVMQVATIDLKREEPGLLAFCQKHGLPLCCFTAAELAETEGGFTSSAFVHSVTGVDNVCERAAVRAGGKLLVPKWAKNGVTVAVTEGELV